MVQLKEMSFDKIGEDILIQGYPENDVMFDEGILIMFTGI